MGAFKEMVIEIEQLQSAVDELHEASQKEKTTLLPTKKFMEIASNNGLECSRMIHHWRYMNGGSMAAMAKPYFPEEFLPQSLKRLK